MFLWIEVEVELLNHMVILCLTFRETATKLFLQQHFAFPPTMNERSYWSTSLLAFMVSVLDFGHSNNCVVVYHSGFNFQFSNDI